MLVLRHLLVLPAAAGLLPLSGCSSKTVGTAVTSDAGPEGGQIDGSAGSRQDAATGGAGGSGQAGAGGTGGQAGGADGGPPDGGSPEGGSAEGGTLEDLECVDAVLTGLSAETTVDTSQESDDYSGSCGGAGAPDRAYQWTAPRDDFFLFHTTDSDIETVLYLRDGDCDGEELACSEEQAGPYRSGIVQWARRGQRIVAVLDGRSGDSGDAVLHVAPVDCPAIQLTEVLLPVEQSTAGRAPYDGAGCGAEGHGARSYRFTAPEDGRYSFLAVRDDVAFRPVITVEEGPACGGPLLQCNGGDDGRAEVLRYLEQGQHVTLVVSGRTGEGPFTLDVERHESSSCIDDELPAADDWSGQLFGSGPHRMTTSCGNASVWDFGGTDPADVRNLPDVNLRVPPLDPPGGGCMVFCDLEITATFPFYGALSELDGHGECAGPELSCDEAPEVEPFDPGTGDPPVYRLFVTQPADGEPKLLTIDRKLFPYSGGAIFDPSGDDYEIRRTCIGVC